MQLKLATFFCISTFLLPACERVCVCVHENRVQNNFCQIGNNLQAFREKFESHLSGKWAENSEKNVESV